MSKRVFTFVAATLLLVMVLGVGSAGAAKIKLNYWHYLSGDYAVRHEELIKQFNATHPDIQVESLYTGNQFVTRDKVLASVAGGQPPDVSLVDQFWPPQMASTGALVPISKFISGPNGIDMSDFTKTALEVVTVNGEIVTMPFSMSNIVMFYNKDMFRAVGLDPEKPPTTWDELVTYAKALTRDVNGDGKTDEWGVNFTTRANIGSVYHFIAFLWQAGGELYTPDFSKVAFNSDAGVAATQFWIDLAHKHKVLSLSPPQQGFETGRIAMQYSSTSSIEATRAKVKFDMGVATIPAGKKKATGVGGSSLAIFKTTAAREAAAWEFVKWMSSTDTNLNWSMMTGYTPLRESVLNSAAYRKYMGTRPDADIVVKQGEIARVRPNTTTYADMSVILAVAVEEALFGPSDPKAALDKAAVEANNLIKSMK